MGTLKYHNGTEWKYIDLPDQNNSTLINNVSLIGVIDGTNKVFTSPIPFSTIALFKNGMRLRPGLTNDYTITGPNQVTLASAPLVTVPETVLTADIATSSSVTINGSNIYVAKEVATGTKNGVNKTLNTLYAYQPGSLQVYYNGMAEGTSVIESNPAAGEFKVEIAPGATDEIETSYWRVMATTGNAATLAGQTTQDLAPIGSVNIFAGITPPSGNWVLCYGQELSRSTYAALWQTLKSDKPGATISIANPAVVTIANHGMRTGDAFHFTTTGALPTGLSANTLYYANVIDANSFRISTTRNNSYLGTWVATSGTQSGVHTVTYSPWGIGNGTTTFNVPDYRGVVLAGKDDMGGTPANLLTRYNTQGIYGYNLGNTGGEQAHAMTESELVSHAHNLYTGYGTIAAPRDTLRYESAWAGNSPAYRNSVVGGQLMQNTGGSTPFNVVQPTTIVNYIIKVL